jgi:hypothetical protein
VWREAGNIAKDRRVTHVKVDLPFKPIASCLSVSKVSTNDIDITPGKTEDSAVAVADLRLSASSTKSETLYRKLSHHKHITMKLSLALLSVMAATSSAFVAQQPVAFRSVSQLQGKAAKSKEEDIEMTRKLILENLDGPSEDEPAAPVEAAPAPAAPAEE